MEDHMEERPPAGRAAGEVEVVELRARVVGLAHMPAEPGRGALHVVDLVVVDIEADLPYPEPGLVRIGHSIVATAVRGFVRRVGWAITGNPLSVETDHLSLGVVPVAV
ncbi:MAG TPA: hypothetical protein VFN89_03445 [Solirubrobacterales bacterium]|nr:hypothetical protein [Solirubrobacterales bacterium]